MRNIINSKMTKRIKNEQLQDASSEISTVYGDMITFIMALFMLLFVLTQNHSKDDTFFTKMQVRFGHPKIEQQEEVTTEDLFVSQVQGFILSQKLDEYASILVDEQKVTLILSSPVLFAPGESFLSQEGKDVLNGLGEIFKQVRNPIVIDGHSDSTINPEEKDAVWKNWSVSFERALSVVKFLVDKYDIPPKQFSAQGYGEFRPIAPNDTPDNRAKNRRIEISIIRVKEPPRIDF